MTVYSDSTIVATGATTAQTRIQHNKTGRAWTISQVSVETLPFRGTAQATVRLNGRYVTSTAVTPSAAQGPPFHTLESGDLLTVDWVGVVAGDSVLTNLYYVESASGIPPQGMGWVT